MSSRSPPRPGCRCPRRPRAKMIEALKAVLDGRLRHEDYGDVRAAARRGASPRWRAHGAATPAMLGQIGMAPRRDADRERWPTGSSRSTGSPGSPTRRRCAPQAEAVLRTRLVYEGTRLDLADQATAPWWLMVSRRRDGDQGAARDARPARAGRTRRRKMMVGVALRQQRGHWDTTPANAWGTIAARKLRRRSIPPSAIAGTTTAGARRRAASAASWPLAEPTAAASASPLPAAPTPLRLTPGGRRRAVGDGLGVSAAVPLHAAAVRRLPDDAARSRWCRRASAGRADARRRAAR